MYSNTRIRAATSGALRARLSHIVGSVEALRAERAVALFVRAAQKQHGCFRSSLTPGTTGTDTGFLLYATTNLGDEIQALASAQFLPLPANARLYGVDRDYLASVRHPRQLTTVLNGWFMHDCVQWPPAQCIRPVFVGFHLARSQLLSKAGVAYLKRYEPIGCRDYRTVKKLEEHGIVAYFSACPTLTFPQVLHSKRTEVLFVDCHEQDPDGHISSVATLIKQHVPQAIQNQAVHLTHSVSPYLYRCHALKTRWAMELLRRYGAARLVVTSRLHCALPCIAMGTPVILFHREWQTDSRFTGYREYIPGFDGSERWIDFDWDNPVLPDSTVIKNIALQSMQKAFAPCE